MLKVFAYLVKRNDLQTKDFIDYYENNHVPLIRSLAPTPPVYKRHYVVRGDAFNVGEGSLDFDVVTEVGFADRGAFEAWITAVSAGPAGERVAADEARFLDRSRTRTCVIEEHVTDG